MNNTKNMINLLLFLFVVSGVALICNIIYSVCMMFRLRRYKKKGMENTGCQAEIVHNDTGKCSLKMTYFCNSLETEGFLDKCIKLNEKQMSELCQADGQYEIIVSPSDNHKFILKNHSFKRRFIFSLPVKIGVLILIISEVRVCLMFLFVMDFFGFVDKFLEELCWYLSNIRFK